MMKKKKFFFKKNFTAFAVYKGLHCVFNMYFLKKSRHWIWLLFWVPQPRKYDYGKWTVDTRGLLGRNLWMPIKVTTNDVKVELCDKLFLFVSPSKRSLKLSVWLILIFWIVLVNESWKVLSREVLRLMKLFSNSFWTCKSVKD